MRAVIQAGGKGTRISSITGDLIPKSMLEIDGYPILYHQIMNLKENNINEITIIIGHLGEVIKDYFHDGKEFGVKINYYEENPNDLLGTAGALHYLKESIKEDFVFLLGDIFISIDFSRMQKFHLEKKSSITLMTHPNSHPFDSDLVLVSDNNKVLGFDSKTNDRSKYDYSNLVNAGVMIFSPKIFKYVAEKGKYSYDRDIVIPSINEGTVYSYKSTEYAKDMGTPERYDRVRKDYEDGIVNARNLHNKQKCIFLDRDGTINEYVPFLKDKEKFIILPGSSDAIKMVNNSEYLTIIVTNQPIIARGESTIDNLKDIHNRMDTLLGKEGAYIDCLYYCPHHPDKGYEGEVAELKIDCECRKPNIGMIKKAEEDFNIDLEQSILVGDSTLDVECAKRAGLKSILVKTGQGGTDKRYDSIPDYTAENLFDAVKLIIEKEKSYGFQKSNKRVL